MTSDTATMNNSSSATWVRPDGRANDVLRPITFQRNFTKYAAGSVLVSFGNTQVLVTATVEEKVPRFIQAEHDENHGWLTAEYAMLPSATHTRNQRERNKVSGRSAEIQRLIGRCLRRCVNLSELGARTITIDADVIQADGGTRVAAITGGFVAVADAIQSLLDKELLTKAPEITPLAAVSVGVVQGTPILDLCYEEDSSADVDANIVMTAKGEFIECQLSSESAPCSRDQFNQLLSLAESGISEIIQRQQDALQHVSFPL